MRNECSLVFPAFLEFENDLKRFITSRVKNPVVAEDLTNDIALKIYNNCQKLPEVKNLRSWLFTLARNTVVDYFREQKKEAEVMEHIDSALFENDELQEATMKCLTCLVDQLPEKYRTPLWMSDIQGLSQKEVASELEFSYTATKSRVQRARKQLKSLFQETCATAQATSC